MFTNIGKKIKTLAMVLAWAGIIGSVLGGIVLMEEADEAVGLLTMLVGALMSWVGSFFMYGFGQLIDNTDKLVAQNTPQTPAAAPTFTAPVAPAAPVAPVAPVTPVAQPAPFTVPGYANGNNAQQTQYTANNQQQM